MSSLQRAQGRFGLTVQNREGQTRCADLAQGGCCRLLFPRIARSGLEAVTVNISGGIVAGDRIEGRIQCREGTELVVTSQAAERIYRARPGESAAQISVTCEIGADATLEWLPHGTIFFDNSHLERRMCVEMTSTSRFLYLENRVFGRTASGEVLSRLNVRDTLSIKRDGQPLLEDRLAIAGEEMTAFFDRAVVAAGQMAVATLVWVAPEAQAQLADIRTLCKTYNAVDLAASAWNGMLVVRGLAASGWQLDQACHALVAQLRQQKAAPVTWRT
ncbi:urease accessory protein UreD [Acetobacter suratthaniensis]|uniref:Urease accessory protein UreD n=1 Tax=Acetobacter suratthaniensis TaxID=1502841 RepID=A0ABS3LLS8_9PROT|nr:urease accessory protein UreD [Acetobacter suratthaniensis]MCX2566446.1 urease accessory protein UreD [Acetobacter suratthaniensis]